MIAIIHRALTNELPPIPWSLKPVDPERYTSIVQSKIDLLGDRYALRKPVVRGAKEPEPAKHIPTWLRKPKLVLHTNYLFQTMANFEARRVRQ